MVQLVLWFIYLPIFLFFILVFINQFVAEKKNTFAELACAISILADSWDLDCDFSFIKAT